VGADGFVGDCTDQIKPPPNAISLAPLGSALYLRNGQDIATNLWGCATGGAGCVNFQVNSSGIKIGGVDGMASDGDALYLLDNLQTQLFHCTRVNGGSFDLQCANNWPTNAKDPITSIAAGQLGGFSLAYLGANNLTGPVFYKCSAKSGQCTLAQPVGGVPAGSNQLPLTLIDMKFAHNGATDAALYLLLGDSAGNNRGIVRCALATESTSTNEIGDLLGCGTYTPIPQSTATEPISIEIR
jgi:hypothetical protein